MCKVKVNPIHQFPLPQFGFDVSTLSTYSVLLLVYVTLLDFVVIVLQVPARRSLGNRPIMRAVTLRRRWRLCAAAILQPSSSA
jgi:hypothetical protein